MNSPESNTVEDRRREISLMLVFHACSERNISGRKASLSLVLDFSSSPLDNTHKPGLRT